MTDEELNQLAEALWKRMEPFAKLELERLFTNYITTRTLLEPELVKKLFEAMKDDIAKFVQEKVAALEVRELKDEIDRLRRRVRQGEIIGGGWIR